MQTPDDSRPAYYPPSTSDHFSGSDEHDRDHSPAGPSGSLSGSEEADGYHNQGNKQGALSILMKLAEALEEGGTEPDHTYYEDDGDSQLLGKPGKQAGFDDIMETGWSADVPKRRVGGIRRAKVLDDIGDDSDEEEDNPVYTAAPFNQPDIEALAEDPTLAQSKMEGESIYPTQAHAAMASGLPYKAYRRQTKVNWYGSSVFFLYVVALFFYLFIRITKTLGLGQYIAYGVYVLIVEILGAISTLLYGVNLLWDPVNPPAEADPNNPELPQVSMPYHVRVLIPCYREPLQIVVKTINAAYDAVLPAGCHRTIYVCDDGKDPKLRRFCRAMGPSVVYVSGRRRAAGEMNGKSGNLNNCMTQIYPEGEPVPYNELICVFDADQAANPDFYIKMLPLFDGGNDVGMVLSPQCFHNLRLHADVFNHANIHFWEYAQHGYDALGFISCTGTNFLIRAMAFQEANWSPTFTLTEDFALGMYLKMNKWHCRYVEEYLAIGEAPDQVRNCFQQRSRWTKGHFQVVFSRAHCPLLQRKLGFFHRILYCSGVFSYIVGAITTPTFILIPLLTVWVGIFPIVVSNWAALGLTIYTIVQTMVLSHCKRLNHVEALWFSGVANNILWWTFAKAFFNSFLAKLGKQITFKATLKGLGGRLAASAFIDLWMPVLCFILMAVSLGIGIGKVVSGPTVVTTLSISVCWIIYGMVPPFLLIHYAFIGRGATLAFWSRVMFILSYLAAITAILLLWFVYPKVFDYSKATQDSLLFMDAMKVGNLPVNQPISWRGNSLTYEASQQYGFPDLTGGWITGGATGNIKMTQPIAFSTSLLAWGMLAFGKGFSQGQQSNAAGGLENVMWGADYLMKTFRTGNAAQTSSAGLTIVYQVGNLTLDHAFYGPPEALNEVLMPRPAYVAETASGASDLAGSMAGALAASAMVVKQYGSAEDAPKVTKYLAAAQQLYEAGKAVSGLYTAPYQYTCMSAYARARIGSTVTGDACPEPTAFANGSALVYFNSSSYYDDMLWAASWLYLATGNTGYVDDVNTLYVHQGRETNPVYVTDWDNVYWAANVLLATTNISNVAAFHNHAQAMLQTWVCGLNGQVTFTPEGRAWNPAGPTTGDTANAALLAAIYGQVHSQYITKAQSDRYVCFSRGQMRFVLGDKGQSLMVGYGAKFPTHVQNEAASCATTACSANALNSTAANPHVLTGAVVEFASFSDKYKDVRSSNDSRVSLVNNAAFPSTLAGLNQAPGSWDSCLQGYGVLTGSGGVCTYQLQDSA